MSAEASLRPGGAPAQVGLTRFELELQQGQGVLAVVRARSLPEVELWIVSDCTKRAPVTSDMYGVTLVLGSLEVELSAPGEVRVTSAQARVSAFFTIYLARGALLRGEDGEPLFPSVSHCAPGPLGEAIARVHEAVLSGENEAIIGASLEIVKRSLATAPAASASHGRRMDKQILGVKRALSLLRADLKTNLSLEVLAQESGLSPYHFARCFQRFTGLAPRPYRRLLRAHAARRLLEQGHSTTRAAAEVGFSDAPHLSRTFRAHFGTSPQTWARAWRASDAVPAQ